MRSFHHCVTQDCDTLWCDHNSYWLFYLFPFCSCVVDGRGSLSRSILWNKLFQGLTHLICLQKTWRTSVNRKYLVSELSCTCYVDFNFFLFNLFFNFSLSAYLINFYYPNYFIVLKCRKYLFTKSVTLLLMRVLFKSYFYLYFW